MSDDTKRKRPEDGAPAADRPVEESDGKPANSAPDAVKDPNEKTGGKPGVPAGGGEADPGAG